MILLGVWGIFKAREHEVVRQTAAATAAAAAAAAAEGEGGKIRGDNALQQQEEGRGGRGEDDLAAAAGVGSPMRGENDPKLSAAAAAVTSTPSSSSSSMEDMDEGMGIELIPQFQFNSTGGGGVRSEGEDCKEDKEEEEEEERIKKSSNGSSSSSSSSTTTARQKARSSSFSSFTTNTTSSPSSSPQQHHRHETSADATEPFLDDECEELDHWLLIRARQCLHVDIESPAVQRIVAFSVGIIHGIAGPGGVLGVLPAARLHSWPKASLYLATFCLTSTLIMGLFAAVYGECTSRLGSTAKIEFRLELFSASLSIIVGVLWMALIIAGKLDVVFG